MASQLDAQPNEKQSDNNKIVDISKRYDVYCSLHNSGIIIVYRDVRFCRMRTLLGMGGSMDFLSQIIELEQANGQTVFISRHGIVSFCEHGTTLAVETFPAK